MLMMMMMMMLVMTRMVAHELWLQLAHWMHCKCFLIKRMMMTTTTLMMIMTAMVTVMMIKMTGSACTMNAL